VTAPIAHDADAAPLLSIVVPTHDTRELTLRCLAALAATRTPSCELLLVDDGSRDGTAEAVAGLHPEVRILQLTGPQGFTAAANAGMAAARGEILWLLNSDAEVEPGAPAALVAAFAAVPWMGIAGAELRTPDGAPAWSGGAAPGLAWLFVLASGVAPLLARVPGWRRVKHVGAGAGAEVDWVSGAALAIRREVWRRAGPLDARFGFYAQDVDLCLRVRDLGWQVMVARGVRVVHHEGGTIGRAASAVAGRFDPALLWTDLVRCVAKRSGSAAGGRARGALLAGATLRVVLRRLAVPLVAPERRAAWRRDTRALAGGVSALRRLDQRAALAPDPPESAASR
jgi:GT2 family glycosyltransferase